MSNKLGSLADVQREWREKFEKQLLLAVVAHPDVSISAKVLDEIAKEFGRPHTGRSLAKKIEKIKGGPARASIVSGAANGGGVSQREPSPAPEEIIPSDDERVISAARKKRQRQAEDDDEDFSPVKVSKKSKVKKSSAASQILPAKPSKATRKLNKPTQTGLVKKEPGAEMEFGEY